MADEVDRVAPDCENVTRAPAPGGAPSVVPPAGAPATAVERSPVAEIRSLPKRGLPLSPSGRIAVPVACVAGAGPCDDGRVTLRRRGARAAAARVLGTARFSLRAGRQRKVRVPLRQAARRTVRRKGRVAATLTVQVGGLRSTRAVVLRAGRR